MSRYLCRIVGPSGMESYLCRGREVDRKHATRYSSPSAARNAAQAYSWVANGAVIYDVIDERDPERRVYA